MSAGAVAELALAFAHFDAGSDPFWARVALRITNGAAAARSRKRTEEPQPPARYGLPPVLCQQ
jgi:hypothetical protein